MDKGLLYDYTQILMDETAGFTSIYFGKGNSQNHAMALEVFRYACEVFLNWTPEETFEYLSMDIIKLMKLDKLLFYIKFPPEFERYYDCKYIVYLMYPDRIKYDDTDTVIQIYKDVLRGQNDGGLYKFPKHYFDNYDGRKRACICLKYMIEHYEVFHSVKEMYAYFASTKGTADINKYGLRVVLKNIFLSPVRFLHETLPPSERDEFWYLYYSFQFYYKKEHRAGNARRAK